MSKKIKTLTIPLTGRDIALLKVALVQEGFNGTLEEYAASAMNENVECTLLNGPDTDLDELAKLGQRLAVT